MVVGLAYLGVAMSLAPGPITGELPSDLVLPERRNFRLAFAYQPPDWSPEAFTQTFDFIGDHADMISHFMDDGVPWPQLHAGEPYPKTLQEDLARRAKNRRPGQRVLLAVNPVATDRVSPALLWESGGAPLPAPWASKDWGDPDLVSAYLEHCQRLVETLEPDFLCYAFEVNAELHTQPPARQAAFVAFLGEVYAGLRARYPELPLFVEVVLNADDYMTPRWAATEAVLEHSDLVGISTYPYIADAVAANEGRVPADWFQRLRDRFPDKPLAVSETGFLGADFHSSAGTWIPGRGRVMILGDEASQAAYVRFLLAEAQRLDMAFVSWWAWRDLDRLWQKIGGEGPFENPMWGQWNHTGLQDKDGTVRSGQRVWDAWRKVPLHSGP